MTRFADRPVVEVSIDIAASPGVVWALVTDIDLPARFQDEFQGAEWVEGDGPAVGSAFRGRNQRNSREWETTSYVVECEPNQAFGWAVDDPLNPGATWTFSLDPIPTGTTLTYHRRVGPGPSGLTTAIEEYPEQEEEIIAARDETHRQNMQAVIEGVKDLAETNDR
jgi:uncharacterized protein YndB with AHSA1/START domain